VEQLGLWLGTVHFQKVLDRQLFGCNRSVHTTAREFSIAAVVPITVRMMSERIFIRTQEFLAGIAALNQLAEAETEPVKAFLSLLQSESKAEKKNDLVVSTLAAILDRVAYFPLRPSDMQVI
jgi:hypothetical protein